MRDITNMWRNFALNDESATVMCTYPEGAVKPTIPVPYCEEAMTGFEYALGALMIKEGLRDLGEDVVRSVRNRYDGEHRNPWNEIECGSNYARSMASFALLSIYSGFVCDMTRGHIGFSPIDGIGRFPFFVGNTWGFVDIAENTATLEVYGEPLTLSSITLGGTGFYVSVSADDKELEIKNEGERVSFPATAVKDKMVIRTAHS